MRRATLKVSPVTADRLATIKPIASADAGRILTTGDTIDYLAKYWLDGHELSDFYTRAPGGRPYGEPDVTSQPA